MTMMTGLIAVATILFAGYNLFIKLSGNAIDQGATTTIVATLVLQITAVAISCLFLGAQLYSGQHTFRLGAGAYGFAMLAGICIAGAEIAYLYLFGGLGGQTASASTAIPVIVGGTIVLSTLFGVFALGERLSLINWTGVFLVIIGLVLVVYNK